MKVPAEAAVDNKIEEISRAAFELRPMLKHVDIMRRSVPRGTAIRLYAPGTSGEMERRVLLLEDVYDERNFV